MCLHMLNKGKDKRKNTEQRQHTITVNDIASIQFMSSRIRNAWLLTLDR